MVMEQVVKGMNSLIALILSAGGAAFLTALVSGLRSISTTRMESEEALIKRLTTDATSAREDAERQRKRAEVAEEAAAVARNERDRALEDRARYRRMLISAGVNPDEDT